MRISLDDVRKYTDSAPLYKDGLIFVQSGVEKKDVDCLLMWLRRLCTDNDGLSFTLITSTHESKGRIEKAKVKTGKVGRPKTVVRGTKAEKHCHGLIINENEDTNISEVKEKLQDYCKKRRKKRPNLKTQKIMNVWQGNLSIVKYMERQADSTHSFGNFDFDYFKSSYYSPPYEDN